MCRDKEKKRIWEGIKEADEGEEAHERKDKRGKGE